MLVNNWHTIVILLAPHANNLHPKKSAKASHSLGHLISLGVIVLMCTLSNIEHLGVVIGKSSSPVNLTKEALASTRTRAETSAPICFKGTPIQLVL